MRKGQTLIRLCMRSLIQVFPVRTCNKVLFTGFTYFRYEYSSTAFLLVLFHDFLDHLDGIVAKVQKTIYGQVDDPILGGFMDAFCDKVDLFYTLPGDFSRRAVVSYWRKYVHEVLVNRLGGLSLPRKSVVRLTDRPDMTLDVYRGRKTTIQKILYFYYGRHWPFCDKCTVIFLRCCDFLNDKSNKL